MPGGTKREQARIAESQVNTRQDRNTFLTDGGTWTWASGAGTLTWSADFKLMLGGVAVATVSGPSSSTGMTAGGSALYLDVNRVSGGGTLSVANADDVTNTNHSIDTRILIGVVGISDGKFYFLNGTVMSDGDSKTFGTLNSLTDRSDFVYTTGPTVPAGFTYVVASNQLAVYVGGILQTLGTHYSETPSDTQITFLAPHIPTPGEEVTCLNVIGGEGPSGASTLQGAYNGGVSVEVTGSSSVWWKTPAAAAPGPIILGTADAAPGGYSVLAGLTDLGWFRTTPVSPTAAGAAGLMFKDGEAALGDWILVPLDDGTGDAILMNNDSGKGFRISKATGGMEFGTYTGAYPGGSWADEGAGAVRHAYYTGSTSSVASTVAATFVSETILGTVALIDDSLSSFHVPPNSGPDADKNYYVTVDTLNNQVELSGSPFSSSVVGGDLQNRPYHVVVFYKD